MEKVKEGNDTITCCDGNIVPQLATCIRHCPPPQLAHGLDQTDSSSLTLSPSLSLHLIRWHQSNFPNTSVELGPTTSP